MSLRDRAVYFAKLAEQAGLHDELSAHMKVVGKFRHELSVTERNLFSVAFKKAVGSRRSSVTSITKMESEARAGGNDDQATLAREYRAKVEGELESICSEVLEILSSNLIKNASVDESRVFYQTMKADYCRHIAELRTGDAKKEATASACKAYEEASSLASTSLEVTNPVRLNLAANFSVFQYEVLGKPEEACRIARAAFEDVNSMGGQLLEQVDEEVYVDITSTMQLLRDNLTLWNSEQRDHETTD